MDIDFHFGTVYVLSRWAGFSGEDAKIIATSSQFVDDNLTDLPIDLDNATLSYPLKDGNTYELRLSGHRIWQKLDEEGNHHVWIPFHFLPGLEGASENEKLICKRNSALANEIINDMIQNKYKSYGLYRLGISLHVYADTWAHQEFSGRTGPENEATDLVVIDPIPDLATRLEDEGLEVLAERKLLGHARAIHWPDRPYATWSTIERFPTGRSRSRSGETRFIS